LFAGTPFELNRITLVRVIATVALLTVFGLAARRAMVVPGRLQVVLEMILGFIRVNIAVEVLGKNFGRKYTPMLTVIFCSVLAFNLTGILPPFDIPASSTIGFPLVLALWVYVMYLGSGVKAQGVGGFLRSSLFPPGAPILVYVLLTPIEFLQVFILRPATLTIRLVANMVAGHLLLALCFAATQFFLFEAAGGLKLFGAVTFVGGIAFTLLDLLVALLQAYVFTILTAVYVNLSVEAGH
jgi:F-type H+-transporting ATPase subunit a